MGIENISEISENTSKIEVMEDGVIIEHLTSHPELGETAQEQGELFGNPERDAEVWTGSENIALSGLMCQKYAAEQLLEKTFAEQDIIAAAEKNGWYGEERGMVFSDAGKLLEQMGLTAEYEHGLTLKELCEMLYNGEKIICPVSSMLLRYPELSGFPGVSADLMVEVIGVDLSGEEQRIIINDPIAEKGGTEHMFKDFLEAWKAGSCSAVSVGTGGSHGF